MATPKEQLANLLAKAATRQTQVTTQVQAPAEPEMVEVTQFIDSAGKVYWAKKARTSSCIARHLVTRQVAKGSAEDQ